MSRDPTRSLLLVVIAVPVVDLVFIAVDIVQMVRGTYMPLGWATVQLLWGVGNGVLGLIFVPVGVLVLILTPGAWLLFGTGVLLLIVGTFLVVEGVRSLAHAAREGPPRADVAAPSSLRGPRSTALLLEF